MRSSRAGFTLMELLIVAVLLGLIAGLAMPRISGFLPAVRLDDAARQVVDALRIAQATAISSGRVVVVDYGLPDKPVRVIIPGSATSARQLEAFPDGVSIAEVTLPGSQDAGGRVAVAPTGYVQPHTVLLRDTHGDAVRIVTARLATSAYRE